MTVIAQRALRVALRIVESGEPYALFLRGDACEFMPAGGPRFKALSTDPGRMASCVGVFWPQADVPLLVGQLIETIKTNQGDEACVKT